MLGALKTSLADLIFPPRCVACAETTDAPHGLCPTCWTETHFISGSTCAKCGAPLIGADGDDACERCQRHPPAWDRGAAALVYEGAGRRMVLGLKHGDRLDLVKPMAGWMATAGRELIAGCDMIAPTPLHWRRLLKRRFNQSAELSKRIGRITGKPAVLDLLSRTRATVPQEKMDRIARAANQAGAFAVTKRHRVAVQGKAVVLVDDVLTTGATLSACADCLRAAGARRIDVLVLARVAFADSLGL
jgi:ComF family protein